MSARPTHASTVSAPLEPAATVAAPDYAALPKEQLVALLLERDRETEASPRRKKYGLVWEDKPEQFEADSVGKIPVIRRDAAKSIVKDATKPTHVLIQGDNYHALKVLTYTHERAVDVIYIDPPYNTGNKDFKYNDRFVDKEDGFRHSKWLSFMAKRLRLAKALLKDTGVIFISIDDNEQAQLKLLCDEVFGENNLIAQLVWKCRAGGGANTKTVSVDHEYVLAYAKNIAALPELSIPFSAEQLKRFGLEDSRGKYYLKSLERPEGLPGERPNLQYSVTAPDGSSVALKRKGKFFTWVVGKPKFDELVAEDRVVFKKGKNGWHPYRKLYLSEDTEEEREARPRSVIDNVCLTRDGSSDLAEVIGSQDWFKFPKPLKLVKLLLTVAKNANGKSAVILDFFAGSGTTAHAVMQLNAEDGGSRQCILVTNDEGEFKDERGRLLPGGICTHVTYPRLSKVIHGYTTPKGKEVAGLAENLAFYDTEFVEDRRIERYRLALAARSVDMLAMRESCFTEEPTPSKRWRSFTNGGDNRLVVVLDERAAEELRPLLAADKRPTVLYAFRFGHDDDPALLFGGKDLEHVTAKPVPDALLALARRLERQEAA